MRCLLGRAAGCGRAPVSPLGAAHFCAPPGLSCGALPSVRGLDPAAAPLTLPVRGTLSQAAGEIGQRRAVSVAAAAGAPAAHAVAAAAAAGERCFAQEAVAARRREFEETRSGASASGPSGEAAARRAPARRTGLSWRALGAPPLVVPRRGGFGAARSAAFQISEERLHEFLQAEVAFFAAQESSSLTLKQVIEASTPERAAELAVQELPIRFAQRILQIESLPGWRSSRDLQEVHGLYSRSFRDLRLVDLEVDSLASFTEVVQSLKGRMKGVIPGLASAMRNLEGTEGLTEQNINNWLDTFLLSRIGTEMLTSQYIAVTPSKDAAKGPGGPSRRTGIVDFACEPTLICDRAAKHVRKLCKVHYNMEQELDIVIEVGKSCETTGSGKVRFPYVPQYLFYILVELLKNSARATVDMCQGDQRQIRERPIIITVGADPSQVAIRVYDSAGGIPFSVADRVWSYMYSTANQSKDGTNFSQQGTPLAGFGVGLPLSRLYARYLGGSLHLMSLPGIGTRAYLYLKRLENEAREELPERSPIGHSVQPDPPL